MSARDLLLVGGVGVGLYLWSQSANANIGATLTGDTTGSFTNLLTDVIMGNTRGERNNNPGNLMFNQNINWQGQTGQDSGGYAVFDTPENGIRAMMIDLKNKIARGLNTLNLLIPVYAPPSDNPTQAYISNVAIWSGLGTNQLLSASDVPALAQAMIRFENGEMIYNSDQLAYAAQAAGVA